MPMRTRVRFPASELTKYLKVVETAGGLEFANVHQLEGGWDFSVDGGGAWLGWVSSV